MQHLWKGHAYEVDRRCDQQDLGMTSCSQPCPQLLWGSLQLLTVRAEGLHAKRRCSTWATREHSRLHASVFKSISKEQDRATGHYKGVASAHFVVESSADMKNETVARVAGVTRGQHEVLTTVDMITQCSNPDCRRELRYLRGGRVVSRRRQRQNREEIWSCANPVGRRPRNQS
jgi:hypothetical protein